MVTIYTMYFNVQKQHKSAHTAGSHNFQIKQTFFT